MRGRLAVQVDMARGRMGRYCRTLLSPFLQVLVVRGIRSIQRELVRGSPAGSRQAQERRRH